MGDVLLGVVDGVRATLTFDPWYAIVASAVAAAVLSRRPRAPHYLLALLVLVAGWWLSDGLGVSQALSEMGAPSVAEQTARPWVGVTIGALGGFLVGYALPTWAGAFVGQRVTWGTGVASAVVVAVAVSGMIANIG